MSRSRWLNRAAMLHASVLWVALGPATPVHALTLSRSEAVARALAAAPDLAELRRAVESARGALNSAPYPSGPVLTLESEGAQSPFSNREYSRRISLEQELDWRGERSARRRVGHAAITLGDAEVGARRQQIAAVVDETVGLWLVAGRRVARLRDLAGHAMRVQQSAEEARRRETVTAFAARLLKADALGLQAEQLEAAREQDQAAAGLRILLGASPAETLAFVDDLSDSVWHCSFDRALAIAREQRHDLRLASAAESLAARRLGLERSLGRGNPTLAASLGRDRTFIDSAPTSSGGTAGPFEDVSTMLGVRASVPLPFPRRNSLAVGEAALDHQRARAERAAREREVAQQVAAACAGLERAEERHAILKSLTTSVAGDLELTENAYRGGRIALEEYLTVRERLLRFDHDLLDAISGVESARAALVRATGMTRDALATHFQPTR